ncbi:MAG: tyrocidine synthetase [Bacteroidetes bacterium]|nr:tyrocidine synthetase [Bacteroidota bacterium]
MSTTAFMNKKIIHTVFENQVELTPSAVAIECSGISITYTDLNKRANRLANFLRAKPVKRNEDVVGCFFPPGINHVLALLSVFKSGAIYLPLSADIPKARWQNIFNVILPDIIICDKTLLTDLLKILNEHKRQVKIIVIDKDHKLELCENGSSELKSFEISQNAETNPEIINDPDDRNYIFHTSGSTGESKAIMGCHKSLSHFIFWEKGEFSVNEKFKVSQLTSITFDASLRDIFLPLCSGGTLCIPDSEVRHNPYLLSQWLSDSKITLVHCVPSVLRSIVKEKINNVHFPDLKFVLVSGEMLYVQDIENWRSFFGGHVEFVNLYGATETTLIKTFFRITNNTKIKTRVVPVGYPISNTAIIISNGSELCKPGEIGELFIKTPFASKGYFANDKLTSRVFVQNPVNSEGVDIVYKTGDLARYDSEYCIELIGRTDSQVKVNGIRIELGEIEGALLEVKEIEKSIVTHSVNSNFDSILSCYYTSAEPQDPENIKKKLLEYVPASYLPSFFIHLEEFPLNINGKIDKRALPKPEELIYDKIEYKAPVSENEKELCVIWSQILGIKKIGVNISFFELGGNSLLAINMISQVYKKWNTEIKLKDFFDNSTVQKLVAKIESAEAGSYAGIPLAPAQSHYKLSSAQKRLWILDQLEEGQGAYHITIPFLIEGELDKQIVEKTIYRIVARHESLRTVFDEQNGEPLQIVKSISELDFKPGYEYLDSYDEKQINIRLREESDKISYLKKGPLFRSTLLEFKNNKYVLILNMHHIISDGVSIGIFIREFLNTYNSFLSGNEPHLHDLGIQYKDYSFWQYNELKQGKLKLQGNYWKNLLSGELPVLALRSDFKRPALKTYNGAVVKGKINEDVTALLKSLTKTEDCTLYMLLFAALNTLMFRYTRQTDLIIGTPVSGRTHNDLREQIGFYVNTLAIRTTFGAQNTFQELLASIKEGVLNAFDNQSYPFEELVEELGLARDRSRSVLFDVMMVLQNTSMEKENLQEIKGLEVKPYINETAYSKFDLTFNFSETDDFIDFEIEYNTDLYAKSRIESMHAHFINVIKAVAAKPLNALNDFEYLTEEEKNKLIRKNNATTHPVIYKTVVTEIEKYAASDQDSTAIVFEGKIISYKELNERANRLSHFLVLNGLKRGDIAAIIMNRSEELVVAFLAVMKAGAAYLPIGPDYPDERIKWMLEDSSAAIIINDTDNNGEWGIISIDPSDKKIAGQPSSNPGINVSIDDTAYVIYTSGSTGRPKGAVLSYKGLYNRILWQWTTLGFNRNDIIAQKTSNTFDVSVWEFFMPLCFGARMAMCSLKEVHSYHLLLDLIAREKITTLHFVPPVYNSFLQILNDQNVALTASLKRVITSGEALSLNTVQRHYDVIGNVQLVNLYGPTEASIDVSSFITTKNDLSIPIGKPVWNTQLYVLDEKLRPLPEGVPGELYIAGVQLAKGYLNNKQLTAERFIDNPFFKGEKMYKTGDLCCWMPDGNIDYIGRIDDQVKISGHRIEPGEISLHLEKYDRIKNSVVLVKENNNREKILVAYYESPEAIESSELRMHLRKSVPDYMIPSFFVWLEKFPLTSSAKIDRKALPEYNTGERKNTYSAPVTENEKIMASVWEEVLGISSPGLNEDFFEAGGHSLKAMQIAALVYMRLGLSVSIKSVFEHTTIKEFSLYLDSVKKDKVREIQKAEAKSSYPLSHSQKRLWIIDQMESGSSTAYNVSGAFVLRGQLNVKAFDEALNHLVQRHEILRTSFATIDNEPRQIIKKDVSAGAEFLDLSAKTSSAGLEELIINESKTVFDLEKDILFRTKLVKTADSEHVFIIVMHHIISDGWAMQVFLKELFSLYSEYKHQKTISLPSLSLQYKDYAVWHLDNHGINEQFWLSKLTNTVEYVNFNYDYPRKEFNAFNGSIENIIIGEETTVLLNRFVKENRTSLSTLMFTTFALLLNKLTGQDKISMGMTVANRENYATQTMLGLFVNTIVVPVDFSGDISFGELLKKETEEITEAFSYQDYPFDILVNRLNPDRNNNHQPLINVAYTFHNQKDLNISRQMISAYDDDGVMLDDLKVGYYSNDDLAKQMNVTSKYDLLMLVTAEDTINVAFEYNTDLFTDTTIKNYLLFYNGIINQFIKAE